MKKYTIGFSALFLTFGLAACSNANQQSSQNQTQTQNQPSKELKKAKKQNREVALAKNETLLHLLQMDPISVSDELKSGKSLVDIGKEKNVTEDQMVNVLIQQREDNLKKRDKTMDDTVKQKLTDQIKKQLERTVQKKQAN